MVSENKTISNNDNLISSYSFATQIALSKASRKYKIKKIISFHNRVKNAKEYSSTMMENKDLLFNKRKKITDHIKLNSYYAIGMASVEEILKLNILQASLLSMKRAINSLSHKPELVLIDGTFAPQGIKNYRTIVNGDEKIKVISAASIVAKVFRDNLMIKLSERFSNYAWESNFGYGTKAHLNGLKKFGITTHHRKGFKPIHKILSS